MEQTAILEGESPRRSSRGKIGVGDKCLRNGVGVGKTTIPSFPCSGFWEDQAGLWGHWGCMELTPAILTYTLPLPALDTHLHLLLFHLILGR